jgi:hypothetical protein
VSDRELLELAAKAVGMDVLLDGIPWPKESVGWFFNQVGYNPPALYDRASPLRRMWAPLTDDADALRLAVKLGMDVDVSFDVTFIRHDSVPSLAIDHGDDKYGATRRAIVMAAAEVGKTIIPQPPIENCDWYLRDGLFIVNWN